MPDGQIDRAEKADKQVKKNLSKRDKTIVAVCVVFLLACIFIGALATANNKTVDTSSDSSNSGSATNSNNVPVDNSTATTNTQSQTPSCTTYQPIDNQTWLEIVKDPDSYKDQCYTIYGEVTQFDSDTGNNAFRADVGGTEQTPSYGFVDYPTNTFLTGEASTLSSVVEKDLFTANVMVLGPETYQTQIGGQTTVPELQVDTITVTGSLSN
jgi:hypothetical protein